MEMLQNIRVAVDAVVFGYRDASLYVLLIQQKFGTHNTYWALPGGLVREDETLTEAVKRELKEETNVSINYLEQLFTFGDDLSRDPRNRVISVSYFGLVDPSKIEVKAATDADAVAWVKIDEVPNLAFDHNEILKMALNRLKAKLTYQPIGFDLLQELFLFSELESLYSTILDKPIDRRNFRKKILSFGVLEETEVVSASKSGRPAKFFRFNAAKYKELSKQGYYFDIKFA
ncbi:NUDIX hydrolase [Flavobacterium pedocola]